MGTKFHVAMFCSPDAYEERRGFYTSVFGEPTATEQINDGSDDHVFFGCTWEQPDSTLFGLLQNDNLRGKEERLAHVGYFFDSITEFEAEMNRRKIDKSKIKVYPAGHRQVFVKESGVYGIEWEFAYVAK